ncbi:MAG: hypothetical protein RLZZ599_560, partial [Bacteroidota bacterium]
MGEHFLHQRVAEELRHHPPFSDLEGGALLLLSENIEILYLHSKQLLFSSGEPLHDRIYFVSKGSMELWREDVLIDLVEPGEMLGLRALFEEGVYKAGAHADAKKDVLLYALPIALVQELLVRNPNTEHFFQLDWK